MLVLCVHSVPQVTAKVAFSVILLQDFISSKKVPADFKCRQLIPSSGTKSTSLWDVSDPDALLAWLNENINVDCEHEVQEDFGVGLGEVQRARATEKVTDSVHNIDSKLRISERLEAVGNSAMVQNTAAAFTKAGSSVKSATVKVLDQPAVASATEAVGSGFRKLGSSISSLTTRVVSGKPKADEAQPPADMSDDMFQPPPQQQATAAP